jgi:hypothetical protein
MKFSFRIISCIIKIMTFNVNRSFFI